jgi:hypothetical protein
VNTALALTVGMARSWVALYTTRLPVDIKEARRSEIDSDLWEQQWLAQRRGDPAFGTAIEVLERMLLGIISDITWRVQAGVPSRADRGIIVDESQSMRFFVTIGVVFALFPIIAGIASIGDALLDSNVGSGTAAFGAISLFAGAAVAVGLLISRRHPSLGIGLVSVGAISIAAAWYWMLVITVPIGIAFVAIAYFRARSGGWPRPAGPSLPTGTGTA